METIDRSQIWRRETETRDGEREMEERKRWRREMGYCVDRRRRDGDMREINIRFSLHAYF
jgi:hypothetical protein